MKIVIDPRDGDGKQGSMTNPLFDLSGQTRLVTGASRGLGQYFGRALARAGADLIVTSRKPRISRPLSRRLKRWAARRAAGAGCARSRQHFAHGRGCRSACEQVHILVNNAGCNVRKPALDVSWDDWNLVLDTNLRGSFFVAQQIARGMVRMAMGASSISAL
jgi:NAD(P)-dependent dehydrogenase (short-subunit alcohol dehydrogenase family)